MSFKTRETGPDTIGVSRRFLVVPRAPVDPIDFIMQEGRRLDRDKVRPVVGRLAEIVPIPPIESGGDSEMPKDAA